MNDGFLAPALQLSLPLPEAAPHPEEIKRVSHGVVYTKSWVVELILDLSGYESSKNLVDKIAIEPSCGVGEFLEPMVRRLSASCHEQGRPLQDCAGSLRAFELNSEDVEKSRERAASVLVACGWEKVEAREIAGGWVRRADFLLEPMAEAAGAGTGVDFVVGNPPYVRLESIDPTVAASYRRLYRSMAGRADIYVGFYERALGLLKPGGVCGFICADRWMLNQYGAGLRKLVTSGFAVEAVVEMHDADAFHNEVLAYPAITVIRRAEQSRALVAKAKRGFDAGSARELVSVARHARHSVDERCSLQDRNCVIVNEWFSGSDPWPCVSPERLKLLKYLEANFAPLQDAMTGTRVGIGVATGADKVFLTSDPNLVEKERLLPMALAKDTMAGNLRWSGRYLVNPWESNGTLVDLRRYSQLRRYFEENLAALKQRNVAKRNPHSWFRTIDKVHHDLLSTPKLLIPDIKSTAHPVLDEGRLYPHHNLYYVVSSTWDLRVLGGILLSELAQFFVECYAVRMQGGYLRFQAQYLRRIRVPQPKTIHPKLAQALSKAFDNRDLDAANQAAFAAYGINEIPD
jgi:adenine-specific DNA-methyltransferase